MSNLVVPLHTTTESLSNYWYHFEKCWHRKGTIEHTVSLAPWSVLEFVGFNGFNTDQFTNNY